METIYERIKRMTPEEILQHFSPLDLWFNKCLTKGDESK